jgi:hypothetical protein
MALPMANKPQRARHIVMSAIKQRLGMTQRDFGVAVGSSHRTAVRWDAGQSLPGDDDMRAAAALVHPSDRALAAEAADAIGETLESLGLEAAPAPPAPPLAPAAPPPAASIEHLVDSIVCAGVEASGQMPGELRPFLHAVFKRALDLHLTLDAIEQALRPAAPPAPDPPAGKKARAAR